MYTGHEYYCSVSKRLVENLRVVALTENREIELCDWYGTKKVEDWLDIEERMKVFAAARCNSCLCLMYYLSDLLL